MKAAGIVCRVDDLVRILFPKEFRRTLHIGEGDLPMKALPVCDRCLRAVGALAKCRK